MADLSGDDAADKIVKQLDYEDVKQKKIFQKFIAMQETQQQSNSRARSHDGPSSNPSHMNTIIEEESQTHNTNISPPNRKNSPSRRGPGASNPNNQQQQSHQQQQNNYDEYADEYYSEDQANNGNSQGSKRPGFRNNLLLQTRFSPQHSLDNKGMSAAAQYDQQRKNRNTPPNRSSQNRTNSHENHPQGNNNNNNERSSRTNSQEKMTNSRKFSKNNQQQYDQHRYPPRQQDEEPELIGHSQLVPAAGADYYQMQGHPLPPPPLPHPQMRKDMMHSQQQFDNRYPADYTRENRWEMNHSGVNGGGSDAGGYEIRRSRDNSGKIPMQQQQQFRQMYEDQQQYMRFSDVPPPYGMPQQSNEFLHERVRMLTMKCQDYDISMQRMAANFADFKDQTFKDSSAARASILNYENTISDLQERIFELQRREDSLGQENAKLKSRINQEQMVRTKCEEDIREVQLQLEEAKDSVMETRREGTRREDEIVHLRQQIESNKTKHLMQMKTMEMNIGQLRDEKEGLLREIEAQSHQTRGQVELQDKQAGIFAENKRLYHEIDQAKAEISDLNHFLEQQKTELYTTKHHLIERSQRETHLVQQIESAHAEIAQLKSLLHRAESQFVKDGEGNGSMLTMNTSFQPPLPKPSRQQQQQQQTERDHFRGVQIAQGEFSPPRTRQQGQRVRSQNSPQQQQQQQQSRSQRTLPATNATTFDFMQPDMQHETPKRSKRNRDSNDNNNNNNFGAEARINREENQTISQQLRNKNIHTPANFLSWEVPDQHAQHRQSNPSAQGQQQQQQMQQSRNNNNNNMQSSSVQQPQQDKIRRNETENDRHADREYQQIYDQYMRDPQRGNENNTSSAPIAAPQKRQNPVATAQEQQKKQAQLNQSIAGIESNLLMLNQEKDRLKNELQKAEETKLKSGQTIRRKNEIAGELQLIENNISQQKTRLRELNALHI